MHQVADRMAQLLLACFIVTCLIVNGQGNPSEKSRLLGSKHRNVRGLPFTANSAMGYTVALAIPLDLPRRNVFYSYNFEANYNLPTMAKDLIPGPLERFDLFINGDEDRSLKCNSGSNNTCDVPISTSRPKKKKRKHKRKHQRSIAQNIFSRKSIYKGLMEKLQSAGYKGRECLLRTICEVNTFSMANDNGVLGSVVHIIFSPSSSKKEEIHDDFYKAESNGLHHNCSKYRKMCKESVLDLISTII